VQRLKGETEGLRDKETKRQNQKRPQDLQDLHDQLTTPTSPSLLFFYQKL